MEDLNPELLNEIQRLADLMVRRRLTEVSLSGPEGRIRLRRANDESHELLPPLFYAPMEAAAVEETELSVDWPGSALVEAQSPLVGFFYQAKIAPGATIKRGESLGTIEAMGIQIDVPSPTDGVLTEWRIADNAPVEFAQPIAVIEVSGGEES